LILAFSPGFIALPTKIVEIDGSRETQKKLCEMKVDLPGDYLQESVLVGSESTQSALETAQANHDAPSPMVSYKMGPFLQRMLPHRCLGPVFSLNHDRCSKSKVGTKEIQFCG